MLYTICGGVFFLYSIHTQHNNIIQHLYKNFLLHTIVKHVMILTFPDMLCFNIYDSFSFQKSSCFVKIVYLVSLHSNPYLIQSLIFFDLTHLNIKVFIPYDHQYYLIASITIPCFLHFLQFSCFCIYSLHKYFF